VNVRDDGDAHAQASLGLSPRDELVAAHLSGHRPPLRSLRTTKASGVRFVEKSPPSPLLAATSVSGSSPGCSYRVVPSSFDHEYAYLRGLKPRITDISGSSVTSIPITRLTPTR
jgi:hypothetical protein